MTDYELLLQNADNEQITIDETSYFCGTNIKGLYFDNYIAISTDLTTDSQKRLCWLRSLGIIILLLVIY